MERPCVVRGGEEPAGAAFMASGCSTLLEFLTSTPLLRNGDVQYVCLTDEAFPFSSDGLCFGEASVEDVLYFFVKGARDREEAIEAGSFFNFFFTIPSSCTRLLLGHVDLASEKELFALCSAIEYMPRIKLSELVCWGELTIGGKSMGSCLDSAKLARAMDAFSSLHSLSLLYKHSSVFFDFLIPALSRPCCRLRKFTVCHLNVGCSIGTMLSTNTSLESFTLDFCFLDGQVVQMLFASLEHNTHLTSLSLCNSHGPGWPLSASFILDSLRVNQTLSSLDLSNTPLEGKSAAAINAQLARNKERVEEEVALEPFAADSAPSVSDSRITVIQCSLHWNPAKERRPAKEQAAKPSTLVPSSMMRLFLCGLPFSGKTTLSRSLVTWNTESTTTSNIFAKNSRSWWPARVSMLDRTRGIEISTLQRDEARISLWDLAGQREYYAFHDQMFPDLSSDAAPSLFFFVWSPIELNESRGKWSRDRHGKPILKSPDSFQKELRYWLRFIASKTLESSRFKPKLSIAITRADLVKHEPNITHLIRNTFDKCRHDFQNHVELHIDWVFEVNARDPCDLHKLGDHTFKLATQLSESRPPVDKKCNQARIQVAELVEKQLSAPLLTKEEFFVFCEKQLGLDSKEMQEAIALSLNRSGDIIYFKELDLVVIDTRWFCRDFMGNLLYFSHKTNQHQTFFSPQYLEDLLVQMLNPSQTRYGSIFSKRNATRSPNINGEELVKLLIGLQLACKKDDDRVNSDIFIPACLCTKHGRQVDPRKYLAGDEGNKTFMGRRLLCKESAYKCFTRGIFPLLQVTFHKILSDRRVLVHLEEDVMAFAFGGIKVLMEFFRLEGEEHFIDILVSSTKESLDDTIEWLQENVILHVDKVCAKPRGIQGVELAYAVIQPASVQNFLVASRRSAVLIEDLQDELKNYLKKEGLDDGFKTTMYTWQVGGFPSSPVVELLGKKQTLMVIRSYSDALFTAYTETLSFCMEEPERRQEPQKPQFGSSPSSKEREVNYDVLMMTYKKVCDTEQAVTKGFKTLSCSIENWRNAMLPKLREFFTFVEERDAGKLPRMFVVTEDNGLVRRAVSAVVPGLQNVRLRLFCECRSAPCHFVDGKPGMSLAKLEDGFLKRGLPYINAILKVAYVLARAGAHVAVGYGDVIPDFTQVLASIVDAPVWDQSTPASANMVADDPDSRSRVNWREGQQWLFNVLSDRNCTSGKQIYEEFGLRRIRLPGSVAAWVCDEHYGEGTPWPA